MFFPDEHRTNDWWSTHHPQLVEASRGQTLARIWATEAEGERSAYDRAFAPHAGDPFRGTVVRRVMAPEQTALDLELGAARAALDAAGLEPEQLDLILVTSLRPDSHVVGDAVFLGQALGARAPAINVESACASGLVGLTLASDLVAAGRHRRILVVVACTYTRDVDLGSSFSWFLGDGAGAMVIEAGGERGSVLLSAASTPTTETCNSFAYRVGMVDDSPGLRIHPGEHAGRPIRDHSERYLRACTDRALAQAGLTIDDINVVTANTPTAWYAQFYAEALGIAPEQVVDTYPMYANCGPALFPANLHTAVRTGRAAPGDLVLAYAIGVGTACAAVLRWDQVAIGGVH